jgi:hypothetical protein
VAFDSGGLSVPIVTSGINFIRSFEIDSRDRVWILEQIGAAFNLLRLDVAGQVLATIPLASTAFRMTIDPWDRPVILHNMGSGAARVVETLEPTSGATLQSVTLAGTVPYEDVGIDHNGTMWATCQNPITLGVFDSSGALMISHINTVPPLGANAGDLTAMRLFTTVNSQGDNDGDTAANLEEIRLGFDPIDSASIPPLITISGNPSPGAMIVASSAFPGESGFPFVLGACLIPGEIPVPGPRCRSVPLSTDVLFSLWLSAGNPWANPFGAITPIGTASTDIVIPNIVFGNVQVHLAMATVNPVTLQISTLSRRTTIVLP